MSTDDTTRTSYRMLDHLLTNGRATVTPWAGWTLVYAEWSSKDVDVAPEYVRQAYARLFTYPRSIGADTAPTMAAAYAFGLAADGTPVVDMMAEGSPESVRERFEWQAAQ